MNVKEKNGAPFISSNLAKFIISSFRFNLPVTGIIRELNTNPSMRKKMTNRGNNEKKPINLGSTRIFPRIPTTNPS